MYFWFQFSSESHAKGMKGKTFFNYAPENLVLNGSVEQSFYLDSDTVPDYDTEQELNAVENAIAAIKKQDAKACAAYVSDQDVHCGEFDIMWSVENETEIHHLTTDDYIDSDYCDEGLDVATEEWFEYVSRREKERQEFLASFGL